MFIPQSARQFGGVAYREEADRGDNLESGGGADKDEAAKAAEAAAAAKVAEEAAAKAAADKAAREKDLQIPKARFDEAVAKERKAREEVERKLAEREAKDAERNKGETLEKLRKDIDELENKLDSAELEGKPEERRELRRQLRAKQEELADTKTTQAESRARALAIEQVNYDRLVERAEQDFPFLVPDVEGAPNPDYNEAMARDILEMKAGFEHAGMSSTAALTRTLQLLKPALDAAKKAKEPPAPAAEDKAKKEKEAKDKAEAEAKVKAEEAKRREEAAAKGIAAAKGQPAQAAASGTANIDKKAEVDVTKMKNKDFDKLPEDEVKRLRGDFG